DGTIPEWTGGIRGALPGWPNAKNDRPNPYANDKVLFTISAANMAQYADKLTDGTKAMFKAYPDSFKMNVYPSRRTAAYPDSLYEAIAKNATTAELVNDGNAVKGVWGAIPFPIPANGNEAIWNHLLRYQGSYREATITENVIYDNNQRLDWVADAQIHNPFYDAKASDKDRQRGTIFKLALTVTSPVRDAGEGYLAIDQLDMAANPRKAWTYDPGERRVRRAPNLAFDTPDRPINVIDDYELFSGSPERYNWKLVGKKEIYVPYNNNQINSPSLALADLTQPGYLDSDVIRYELHRVWVVEATVKEGERHLYSKRVNYIDEDSWGIIASDKYDGNGSLWRVGFSYPVVAAEIPLTGPGMFTQVDLKKGGYYMINGSNDGKGWSFNTPAPKGSFYTPAAVRRRGR
ncbi:MAG: DUF1329 domain-containing protein, partial [Bermanella sp.]